MADKLVISHHSLLSPRATFEDGANALITADKQLNKGRNEAVIRDIFIKRGILPNPNRNNKRAGASFNEVSARPKTATSRRKKIRLAEKQEA